MSQPSRAPLAAIAHEVAEEWDVELGQPFALARFSFVAPAGAGAVLKVTPPEDDEADEEPDALAFWAGEGAVRLLRRDDRRRAMLIERAAPGSDLGGARRGRGNADRGLGRQAPLASRLDAIPLDR